MRETVTAIMAGPRSRGATQSKQVAHNTVRYVNAAGETVWRLHQTDIVTKHLDGTYTLNSGSWRTPTTKDRLNRFSPVSIGARQGIWWIGDIAYFDGIRVDEHGKPVNATQDTSAEQVANVSAIKKRVSRFLKCVDEHDELPHPNGGDCWYCSMRSADGKTMASSAAKRVGDIAGNDHIESHIEENYLHGSLIVNALRFKGYQDRQLPYVFQLKSLVKRALRAYLYQELGIGAKQVSAADQAYRFSI